MDFERISFVATSDVLGGGELFLLRTAAALSITVPVRIVGFPGSPLLCEAKNLSLPVRSLELGRKLGRRTAIHDMRRFRIGRSRLDQLILQGRRELFVLQYKWEQILWAGRHTTDRVVLWEHGPIPVAVTRAPYLSTQLRTAFRSAREVFVMSDPAFRSVSKFSERTPRLLLAGVDIAACSKARTRRADTRRRLGLPSDAVAMGVIGRLTRDKGIYQAMDILERMPVAVLLVCGTGPAQDHAEAVARRKGLNHRIRWLGWRDDALDVIAAMDALLLLSQSEGRPLVALEAQAVGTPVVGLISNAGLAALSGEPGIYCSLLDPNSIAAVVAEALASPRHPHQVADWDSTADTFVAVLANSASS